MYPWDTLSAGSTGVNKNVKFDETYGKPMWKLRGNIDECFNQDLVWRRLQTRQDELKSALLDMFPKTYRNGDQIILPDGTRVSLDPKSQGSYVVDCRNRGVWDENNSTAPYLGPYLATKQGWLLENVAKNLIRYLSFKVSSKERRSLNEKACHQYSISSLQEINDLQNFDGKYIEEALKKDDFIKGEFYDYKTETGAISFRKIYYKGNNSLWMTCSKWTNTYNGKDTYDLLLPTGKLPPYNLDGIVNMRSTIKYVVIADNEIDVKFIYDKMTLLLDLCIFTTFIDLYKTDWEQLKNLNVIILPANSPDGCNRAYNLYSELIKMHGIKPKFVKREQYTDNNTKVEWVSLARDAVALTYPKGECDIAEFAEHNRRVFGVEPPNGILPISKPLLELNSTESEPEWLLNPILRIGDQMNIHSWRGSGKSLFALFVAICLAYGVQLFDGRICPRRKYRVLYLDGELQPRDLIRRAKQLCKSLGLPEEAANGIRIYSTVEQNVTLHLDTKEGFQKAIHDMMEAEVIIVDCIYKFFPSCMSNEASSAAPLTAFYEWGKKNGKTIITIDHEGKNRTGSFGTMAKEIPLDTILQLKNKNKTVEVEITKNRNAQTDNVCWLKLAIESTKDEIRITQKPEKGEESNNRDNAEAQELDKRPKLNREKIERLRQIIIDLCQKFPDKTQKEICELAEKESGYGRSTVQREYKELREAGKLPGVEAGQSEPSEE